jgi:hypothetical protein
MNLSMITYESSDRSYSLRVWEVNLSAFLDKKSNYRNMAAFTSEPERCHAILLTMESRWNEAKVERNQSDHSLRVNVRSQTQKKSDHFQIAFFRSQMEGSHKFLFHDERWERRRRRRRLSRLTHDLELISAP